MRGYGIRLFFIFQSLQQVKECYGEKASVILDNIATQQYFAINSLETAEAVSKRIGDMTIRVSTPSSGYGTGTGSNSDKPTRSWNSSTNSGTSTNQIPRKVLLPDEILRLSEDVALIFHKNMPVIPARLLRYYDAPEFAHSGLGRNAASVWLWVYAAAAALAASIVFAVTVARMPVPKFQSAPPQRRVVPGGRVQGVRPVRSFAGVVTPRLLPQAGGRVLDRSSEEKEGSDGQ